MNMEHFEEEVQIPPDDDRDRDFDCDIDHRPIDIRHERHAFRHAQKHVKF